MFPQLSHAEQPMTPPMTENARPQPNASSSHSVVRQLKQRHWLELAEYVSLASSAVGSLVVALSGQAFYGVAPLTVALSLNIANRYRLEKQVQLSYEEIAEVQHSVNQLEQNAVKAIWGVRQQLQDEMTFLQHQFDELPHQDSLESAHRAKQVAVLNETVTTLQDNITTTLEEIRQQFQQEITATQQDLQQNIQGVNGQVSDIKTTIETWQNAQSSLPNTAGVDLIKLQEQLNQLTLENQEMIKPNLKRIIAVMRQLQSTSVRTLPKPPKPLSTHPENSN